MKREALFEGVRNEQGILLLKIAGTGIGMYMPSSWWKDLMQKIKISDGLALGRFGGDFNRKEKKDIARKDKVVEMIKEALAKLETGRKKENSL